MKKPYLISLDLYEKTVKSTENCYVQGDSDVYPLYIKLLSNGDAFTLPAGAVISINFENQKTGIINRGIAEIADAAKGVILYNFVGSEICVDGEFIASVVVQNADERLTWQKFKFNVDKSLDDGRNVAPTKYVPWTAQIDAEISKIKKEINSIEVVGGILAIDEVKTKTIAPDEPANVNVTAESGKLNFSFQIPKGEPGKDGKDGKDGTGEGGGSNVKVGTNGKLIIDEVEQFGLIADNADKLGGYSASAFAKISDIPGAAPVLAPTITLTNLIKNADFTQGANGIQDWMLNRTNLVKVENGCITITNNHSSNGQCGINQTFADLNPDHIYFVNCKMRYHMNRSIADGAVRRVFSIASDTKTMGYMMDVPDTWMSGAFLYGFSASRVTKTGYWLFGTAYNANNFVSGDYTIEFKEPQIVDITAAFGAGNEPNQSWCIRNIPFFVGTKTISIKDYRIPKTIFLGDSIQAGNSYWTKPYPYWLDTQACNCAFGSTCIISNSSAEPNKSYSGVAIINAIIARDFTTQRSSIEYFPVADVHAYRNLLDLEKTDFGSVGNIFGSVENIFLGYGTNDFNTGVAMGSDDKDDRTTNTFKGAMRYIIEKIQTNFPNARLFYVTPPYRSDKDPYTYKNTKDLTLVDYINATKEVCAQFGVPVIDTLGELGVTSYNTEQFLSDVVHPSGQGAIRIAKLVGAKTGLGVREIN